MDRGAESAALVSRAGHDLVGAGMRAAVHFDRSQVSPEKNQAVAARIAEVEGSTTATAMVVSASSTLPT